ncbi:hypothetical protein NPIL_213931 [Nephila pilipes]|uniref:Uncharacterized protein n=1 Tax=Nephila pilipes TaxID=299642 RepID=A0A8X6TSJ2_NEPPI|nr:hypothetical protein NPIL_213931 [Nephila pilipes]
MSQLKDGRRKLPKTDDDSMSENGFILVVRQVYLTCCPSSVLAVAEVFVYTPTMLETIVYIQVLLHLNRAGGLMCFLSTIQSCEEIIIDSLELQLNKGGESNRKEVICKSFLNIEKIRTP